MKFRLILPARLRENEVTLQVSGKRKPLLCLLTRETANPKRDFQLGKTRSRGNSRTRNFPSAFCSTHRTRVGTFNFPKIIPRPEEREAILTAREPHIGQLFPDSHESRSRESDGSWFRLLNLIRSGTRLGFPILSNYILSLRCCKLLTVGSRFHFRG